MSVGGGCGGHERLNREGPRGSGEQVRVEAFVAEANRLHGQHGLRAAVALGELVLDTVHGGDVVVLLAGEADAVHPHPERGDAEEVRAAPVAGGVEVAAEEVVAQAGVAAEVASPIAV